MRKETATIALLSLLLSSASVFAQTATDGQNATFDKEAIARERMEMQMNIKNQRQELQDMIKTDRMNFQQEVKSRMLELRTSTTTQEERKQIKDQLQARRMEIKENAKELRENLRETAKEMRDQFREKVKDARTRVRIAAAHARGLALALRYKAAIARFGHILERLESRTQKLQDRGIDVSSVTPLIEEAKNMQVEAEAKLEELKAKYEELLQGDDPKKVGELAKEIALEIKQEIKILHDKLREILSALKALTPEAAPLGNDGSATGSNENE